MKEIKFNPSLLTILLICIMMLPLPGAAATTTTESSGGANPVLWLLIGAIILLAFAITALSGIIKNISDNSESPDKNSGNVKNENGKINGAVILLFLSLYGASLQAESANSGGAQPIAGIPFAEFYFLLFIILIEVAIVFSLLNIIKLRYPPIKRKIKVKQEKEFSILEKFNDSVSIEKEEEILLDHEYDGIRELDNQLPPWWKYGFYLTIIVAVIYLLHYHVLKTGELQEAELTNTIKKENEKVAAFLKESASNVDELSVKYLDNPTDKAAGKEIFVNLCSSCHGRLGEGGAVGPNLTDDYWIHGGSISEIFKSVKYGWPDKGMRSWKDELSPVKMAQISSFIKSIRGSNPPNAKEKQGELFVEGFAPVTDSTGITPSADTSTTMK